LTDKGRSFLGKAPEFVQVDVGDLTVGRASVATIVRGAAHKVKRGIEQRDEAIKFGAEGATVLIFKNNKLRFHGDFAEVDEETNKVLTEGPKSQRKATLLS